MLLLTSYRFTISMANSSRIAISVYNSENLEGYQIKGVAEYVTEGNIVENFKNIVEKNV